MQTMKDDPSKTIKVAILMGLESKVNRDRFAGILRHSVARSNWEIRTYTSEDIAETLAATADERKALWMPDGIILVGECAAYQRFRRFCRTICRRELPCVAIDVHKTSFVRGRVGTITTDDRAIGRSAAQFFLRRHFSDFAYVGTRDRSELWHCAIRHDAFAEAVSREGFSAASFHLFDSGRQRVRSLQELAAFLRSLAFPCALFAFSDEVSRTVLDVCRFAGIRVPEQISILGVDDQTEITENTLPALSSILPDFEASGYRAAVMLDALLDARTRPDRLAETASGIIGISERASTQDTRGHGRIVSLALEYIRLHYATRVHTEDIAAKLNLSSRLIEKSFREILGCTVLEKTTELRLDKAVRLLTHTNMTPSRIAAACGYATAEGLNIAFRKRYAQSLVAFRKVLSKNNP